MDNTTALNITTQSIHDLTVAVERIAHAVPEPDRKSALEASDTPSRKRRSSLLAMLDRERNVQPDQ
ncbi:hypothetical protein J0H33_06015 [bacterium]|nr:hypothetical protein [bacterium]